MINLNNIPIPKLRYECKGCTYIFGKPLCLPVLPPKYVCPRCKSRNYIVTPVDEEVDLDIALTDEEYDIINKPKHYNVFEIEVIDMIDNVLKGNDNYTKEQGYYVGNVLKYVSRAGLKNDKEQDLKKAQYYLNRLIGSDTD